MIDIKKKINLGIKFLTNKEYRFLIFSQMGKGNNLSDEEYLKKIYKARFGKDLNLECPQTYNEKLQWLKLYYRRPEFTLMVDKYRVREYVKKVIGEEYLIPLIGVWERVEDIDFSNLGKQFVLKCNHNSGLGMCICRDISELDIDKVKAELTKGIEQDYYMTTREWPYKNVERKIIAEKYITDESGTELKDYKFYCFNGKVKLMMLNSDRFSEKPTKADYFDRQFNPLDFKWGYENAEIPPKKPELYDEMLTIAEKLSKGIPHVRIDLYSTRDKIYFGEMTFFDGSGLDRIEPIEWDYRLGSYIELPQKYLVD